MIELQVDEGALLMRRIENRIAEMKARGEPLRDDDNAEVLRQRLEAYRQLTAPLVAYYRKQNVLRTVNGMAPIPDVTAAIDKALPAEPAKSRRPKPKPARNRRQREGCRPAKPPEAEQAGPSRSKGKKSANGASNARKTAAGAQNPGGENRKVGKPPAPLSRVRTRIR